MSVQANSMRETRKKRSFNLSEFIPHHLSAQISQRYDIEARPFSSGGYGQVYLAADRDFPSKRVAIKRMTIVDKTKKAQYDKEVSIMKELNHPNICKLLETYEQDRVMFFVMEFCEGGEVFERIMETSMIAESEVSDIINQCAKALKYAHARGIAHRDMKPENLCFCSNDPASNEIKVIDWGLGHFFEDAKMVSAVGSLTYAAPEVLEPRASTGYTEACDLWSIGVVTYIMLCGKPPFWGSYTEQLRRMKREMYPMSDDTWRAVSPEGKDFVKRLLKANPRTRMTVDAVLAHPWMRVHKKEVNPEIGLQVLHNLKQFSNTSAFFSMCVGSVARQLDHASLRDVHRVFCEMDTNGDGVLDFTEVHDGFKKIFGEGSHQLAEIEEIFRRLDMDGNGTLDYTEFCAAGIGQRVLMQTDTLWCAFKCFDVDTADSKLTADEIKKVLRKVDEDNVWTDQVIDDFVEDLMQLYDKDQSGHIDFEEWLELMRNSAHKHQASEVDSAKSAAERKMLERLEMMEQKSQGKTQFDEAYNLLERLDKAPTRKRPNREGMLRTTSIAATKVCHCRQS